MLLNCIFLIGVYSFVSKTNQLEDRERCRNVRHTKDGDDVNLMIDHSPAGHIRVSSGVQI